MKRSAMFGFAATTMACLLLSGCGGGGGGGGDGTSGSEPGTVTESFAKEMAGLVTGSTDLLSGVAEISAGVLEGAATAMEAGGGLGRPAGAQVTIPLDTACPQGGSASLTVNDGAPEGELSAGDEFSILFDQCAEDDDGEPLTLNGTMAVTVDAVSGGFDTPPFRFDVTISFQGFSYQTAAESGSVAGTFTFTLESADGDAVTFTLASESLTATENGTTETLTDFSAALTVTESTGDYSFSLDGTLESEKLGGAISVETAQPFQGTGDDNPISGTMVITDSSTGAKVTVQVVDDLNVDLLVDEDGDGATDFTVHTTWDELEGS
ncbi:MAG: hypothetical protein GXP50_03355 [Deltaproteobacteria bacterium]|nr:hypothetical protein [Deltaproteobacteria bacterium]